MKGEQTAAATATADTPAGIAAGATVEEKLANLTEPAAEAVGANSGEDQASTGEAAEESGEKSLPEGAEAGETDEGKSQEGANEAAEGEESETGKHRNPAAERRIAELTAKRKAAEAEATEAKTRLAELEKVAMERVPLMPEYLTEDQIKLIDKGNELIEDRTWLVEHLTDGGKHPRTGAELSPAEVGKELAKVLQQDELIALAREVFRRAQAEQWDDTKRGRALRLAGAAKLKPAAGAQDGAGARRLQPAKPAMKVAAPSVAASKPVSSAVSSQGVNLKRFKDAGATDEALAMELANL